MSEHRVPMLGASWRRYEDPAVSRDPRVRAVVGALAALPSPEPRPEFRAELRAQLVAIAPRVIAESVEATTPLADAVTGTAAGQAAGRAGARPRHTDSASARIRGLRRPLAVAATVITAFVLLFGGAVWMSQKALPGDTLYGLKRASESWQLATAGNATDKARDYLNFAKTRVDEARQLASRATASAAGLGPQAGGIDSHTASLITSTLASADDDVTSASSLLGEQAVKKNSTSPLDVLTTWGPGQLARLHELAAAMPDSALRSRANESAALVTAALERARAIAPKVTSECLDTAGTDSLGPLPEGGCSSPGSTPTTPHQGPAQQGSMSSTTGPNGRPAGASSNVTQPTTAAPTPGTASGSTSSSGLIQLPPVLGSSSTSAPVAVDSCGLGVSVGPLGIGVKTCDGG